MAPRDGTMCYRQPGPNDTACDTQLRCRLSGCAAITDSALLNPRFPIVEIKNCDSTLQPIVAKRLAGSIHPISVTYSKCWEIRNSCDVHVTIPTASPSSQSRTFLASRKTTRLRGGPLAERTSWSPYSSGRR